MDPQQQPGFNQNTGMPDNNQNQFNPIEPPKAKKTGLLVAVVLAIVVILGIIAFVVLKDDKKDNSSNKNTGNSANSNSNADNSTANSDKFQKYDVNDTAAKLNYAVSFYKGASVSEKNGHTYLIAGEAGSQSSIYLTQAKGTKIDCGDTPSTTMEINGASSTICYTSSNMLYAGYATVQSITIQLNLAGQKPVSMDDAKAILESVTFK